MLSRDTYEVHRRISDYAIGCSPQSRISLPGSLLAFHSPVLSVSTRPARPPASILLPLTLYMIHAIVCLAPLMTCYLHFSYPAYTMSQGSLAGMPFIHVSHLQCSTSPPCVGTPTPQKTQCLRPCSEKTISEPHMVGRMALFALLPEISDNTPLFPSH